MFHGTENKPKTTKRPAVGRRPGGSPTITAGVFSVCLISVYRNFIVMNFSTLKFHQNEKSALLYRVSIASYTFSESNLLCEAHKRGKLAKGLMYQMRYLILSDRREWGNVAYYNITPRL